MVTDDKTVTVAVDAALSENSDAVADYRAGKERAFGFLMGQAMKKLNGTGNPDMVKKYLKDKLND